MALSLRFKWMATLLLTSLVGVLLVGFFAYRTAVTGYDRLRSQQAQTSFVTAASDYYQTHGSWDGMEEWLRNNRPPGYHIGPGQGGDAGEVPQGEGAQFDSAGAPAYGPPAFFALANENGDIVVGSGPMRVSQQVPAQQLEDAVPIVVNGEVVGRALVAADPPGLDPRERDYLNSTNQALLGGALGASVIALLIGLVLSRTFLRPLTELTRAITAMRGGELNQQVEVRTSDELGVLARTFNEMSAEIHRANQLRKQMTADIAHDLRTPLLVISGYIEALQDGTLKPTPERLEAMNQEATLLKRLIEDLRTLSLSDAGELKLVLQPVPPRDLLEQVRQSFEPIAAERGVALSVEAAIGLPDVAVDRDRMVQVLGNLVNNSLRHTPSGGRISLRAIRQGNASQLVVTDNGSGIAEDKLPNIFERFYHGDESRSQGESGLGLAIARSIVEAHGGTISVDSKLGSGTSMRVTLRHA